MKKLIFSLLIAFPFIGNAQTFTIQDTSFHVGDSLVKQIIFHFNHNRILDESLPTLDSLISILKKYEKIEMEISIHTDSRGSKEYNKKLSEGRSNWIYEYFVKKGITSNRLTTKGYGESALIYTDEEINSKPTEEEREELHAKNRRTVFKIIAL